MRLALLLILAAVLVSAAPTASVAGKWTGTVEFKTPEGETMTPPFTADLKSADGKVVTGTITSGDSPEIPIANGLFDGEKFTFTVSSDEGIVYNVKFVFDGPDKMNGTFDFTPPNGNKMNGKVTATRNKTT